MKNSLMGVKRISINSGQSPWTVLELNQCWLQASLLHYPALFPSLSVCLPNPSRLSACLPVCRSLQLSISQSPLELCWASRLTTCSSVRLLLLLPLDC